MNKMPLLEMIQQTSFSYPAEWLLRDVAGIIYYVRFTNGNLIVRKDNRYTGKELMRIEFPGAKLLHYMSTEAMLANTGFRMNHDKEFCSDPPEVSYG